MLKGTIDAHKRGRCWAWDRQRSFMHLYMRESMHLLLLTCIYGVSNCPALQMKTVQCKCIDQQHEENTLLCTVILGCSAKLANTLLCVILMAKHQQRRPCWLAADTQPSQSDPGTAWPRLLQAQFALQAGLRTYAKANMMRRAAFEEASA